MLRTSVLGLLGLLAFASGCNRGDRKLSEECQAFLAYSSESGARAQAAVPMEERPKATTGPERAAWHRTLAAAYEQESRMPAQLTHPRIAGFEAEVKRSYSDTAAALRKTADGFEKGDSTLVSQGQIEDAAASGARQQVIEQAVLRCNEQP